MRCLVVLGALIAALVVGVAPAGATRECDGLMICVPRAGPWVVVPTSGGVPRPEVQYQLSCPKGHVVGGLDAELSQRAVDVGFLGMLGSPVNPGVTTSQSVVFVGSYVGSTANSPTFRPHVGCMPASGGGTRVPTASPGVVLAGHPTVRRVRSARIRPGGVTISRACLRRERLVSGFYALGFYTRRPPTASLVASIEGAMRFVGNGVSVDVRGDAEIGGVRAVVQVQAVCASVT